MTKEIEIDQKWMDGKVREQIIAAAMRGLKITGELILGESKKKVPIDTGTLMRSGTVNADYTKNFVEISFNTPYARKQHEIHKSKSKYLERPFQEHSGKAKDFIEKELKKI
jgi:hypothetical protein